MSVSDEAVEAAAKAHQAERSKLGYSDWDELNDLGKGWRLDHMRKALAAAAPFIAAQAWDEGFKQGGPMHDVNMDDPDSHTRNPYRSGT